MRVRSGAFFFAALSASFLVLGMGRCFSGRRGGSSPPRGKGGDSFPAEVSSSLPPGRNLSPRSFPARPLRGKKSLSPPPGPSRVLLTGRVAGSGGEALSGAEVFLYGGPAGGAFLAFLERRPLLGKARCGPGGRWTLSLGREELARVKKFHLAAWRTGYAPARRDFSFPEGKNGLDLGVIRLERGISLWGVVLDGEEKPLEGARVFAWGPASGSLGPVKTGPGGRYSFPGFPPGVVKLVVEAGGFAPASGGVVIPDGAVSIRRDFHMERGLSVSGRVWDGTGLPVAWARVLVERKVEGPFSFSFRAPRESCSTGPEGRFRIGALERGARFNLVVKAAGFMEKTLRGVKAGTEGLEIALERGGGVRGKVLDSRGKPAFPFRVEGFSGPSGRWVVQGRKDGTFSGTGLSPGWWRFKARGENGLESRVSFLQVRKNEIQDLGVLRFPRPASLQVLVLDSLDRPVRGARVLAVPVRTEPLAGRGTGPPPFPQARTGKLGKARFERLAPGRWNVKASRGGFSSRPGLEVLLGEGERRPVVLRLLRGGSLLVRALDPRGRPRPGSHFVLSAVGGKSRYDLETGAGGEGRAAGLPPGEYEVRFRPRMKTPFQGVEFPLSPPDTSMARRDSWVARVEPGKETRLEVTLPGKWELRGTVLDGRRPAPGVEVRLYLPERGEVPLRIVLSGLGGAFGMKGLEPGSYEVGWGRPGCAVESRVRVDLGLEGGVLEKGLVLPAGAIEGRVVDREGRPRPGLAVGVERRERWGGSGMRLGLLPCGDLAFPFFLRGKTRGIRTGRDGRFLLREVPRGRWKVLVRAGTSGGILASREVTVKEGEKVRAGTLVVQDE